MIFDSAAAEAEPRSDVFPQLSAQLAQAALRALVEAYDQFNYALFKDGLRRPSFSWTESKQHLGRWCSAERQIEISQRLLLERGWSVLLEVLKHEMAHQYVDEVLRCDETSHGPQFRQVCERRGIDARAAGYPRAADASSEDARLLERVAKLLALAESSNQHEAQNAMNAAQRLMLKYNLEIVGRPQSYRFKHLGVPSGRVGEAQRTLASILQEHFFVQIIWVPVWRPLEGKRGTLLEVCGTAANLELAAYVFDFLTHTSERLWREFKRSKRIRGNAERRTFLAGVLRGFMDKLNAERVNQAERGLVWVADPELHSYYRQRHPRIRSTYFGAGAKRGAYQSGREIGRNIILHRGVSAGPSSARRLLGPRA